MKRFLKFVFAVVLFSVIVYLCTPFIMKTLYPLKYEDTIEMCSKKYGLDKYFIMGIISAESRFSEDAVSHKDAKGLMQLKDETAVWCAEKFNIDGEIYEPKTNIEIGSAYIRYLLDIFLGNKENALAAYNAGQGKVVKWLKNEAYSNDGKTLHTIPYKETREYIKRVQKRAEIYKKLYK